MPRAIGRSKQPPSFTQNFRFMLVRSMLFVNRTLRAATYGAYGLERSELASRTSRRR
jgi:hypothetical protein